MYLALFGTLAKVSPIRPDHPVYRMYYTFEFQDEIASQNVSDNLLNSRIILKGLWLNERLVGIISPVGYGRFLDNGMDLPGKERFAFESEEMRLLINCIVFSLTREESVALKYSDYQ